MIDIINKYKNIRIGTRGSKLALAQTQIFIDYCFNLFPELPENYFEIIIIKTSGDKIQNINLYDIGGKNLFTKEIEEAMFEDKIDIAIHSMKDVSGKIPDSLFFPCILPREDVRDAFLSVNYKSISDLPYHAIVGTSSPRRTALLLNKRPDINIIPFRGNIVTRLEKLENNLADATFLAVAGLKRINISQDRYMPLEVEEFLPAAGQGAIGIQCKKNNLLLTEFLDQINDIISFKAVEAERGFLEILEADCKTPLAAYATIKDEKIFLQCLHATLDGKRVSKTWRVGNPSDAYIMGIDAGKELKQYL